MTPDDQKKARAFKSLDHDRRLVHKHPSLIKRPVLDLGGGKLLVGFTPELYNESVVARR
jgi:arsenate reductase-like glutaredoxin family protein